MHKPKGNSSLWIGLGKKLKTLGSNEFQANQMSFGYEWDKGYATTQAGF